MTTRTQTNCSRHTSTVNIPVAPADQGHGPCRLRKSDHTSQAFRRGTSFLVALHRHLTRGKNKFSLSISPHAEEAPSSVPASSVTRLYVSLCFVYVSGKERKKHSLLVMLMLLHRDQRTSPSASTADSRPRVSP